MITDVEGVAAGHWTDEEAATGCTVVLLPEGTVASAEVRGGAPGSRELDLLAPERMVQCVDAVVLTGGSAFGLAACDGVMRWCEQRGRGFPTSAGVVPIVTGLVLYDLGVGDPGVRPGPDQGFSACEEAVIGAPVRLGRVGAGTGATVGKWWGPDFARPGGLGSATEREGDVVVAALVAVNAVGDLVERAAERPVPRATAHPFSPGTNTTIGVVATNAALDKVGCLLVAQGAHTGLSRVLEPVHTTVDGDAFVAAATGAVEAAVDTVRILAARAVAAAVRGALA